MSVASELGEKDLNVESIAQEALRHKKVLSELLEGVLSKKDVIRFNSFKVLLLLSQENPGVIYPHWDFFQDMIDSDNSFHKYIAIYIIANLTSVDTKKKFEKMFDTFYHLLDDKSVIPPVHLAGNSGKIARAKPHLQAKITDKLLSIDTTHHRSERKDLIKGHIIETLDEYFEEAENKETIIEFARGQLNSKSPRTRKKAKEFLKKWQK